MKNSLYILLCLISLYACSDMTEGQVHVMKQ